MSELILCDFINACFIILVTSCSHKCLPISIHHSMAMEYSKVRGYMEMHSTCNLVDVQMMHGIYMHG